MCAEPKANRVIAFVDGQALFFAARTSFGYRSPNYNPSALASAICQKQTNWNLVQTRFYSGIPSPDHDLKNYNRWQLKIEKMRRQNTHVFTRELKSVEKIVTLPNGETMTEKSLEEKGVDVRIALDIVRLAYEKTYDVALVFSQDQDLSEVVEDIRLISQQQVREIGIACAYPCSVKSTNRRGINKTSWIEIDRTTYDACLDPHDYLPKAYQDKPATVATDLNDEEKFLAEIDSIRGRMSRQYAEHILMHAKMRKLELHWSEKATDNKVICMLPHQNAQFPVLIISTNGMIRVPVKNKANRLIFPSKEIKLELLRMINTIPDIAISEEKFREDPCIQIDDLLHTDRVDSFFDAIDSLIERIKNTPIPVEEKSRSPLTIMSRARSLTTKPKPR